MTESRLVQLDVLRAICVFLVLGRHLNPCPEDVNYFLHKFTLHWNYGGWVGVDIFFVLSGFLVSGLIFREYQRTGDAKIKRFLIRRGLKIYPSFYILIAATVLINPLFGMPVPFITLLAEIFFLQNTIFGRLWGHTWSLAVEEHFYIGLAILSFLLLRFKRNSANVFSVIPYIFVVLAVVCLVLRLLMASYKGTNISPTPFRIDSLFFGVTISYLWYFKGLSENVSINRYRYCFVIVGIILLLPMFFFMSVTDSKAFIFGLTTNYIAAGLLLIGLLKIDIGKSLLVKVLSYIGMFSYSIYLWHLPVQEWIAIPLNNLTKTGWFFYAGVYLTGAVLIGILLSKLIEYPILRLRDRYFPSQTLTRIQF